MSQLLVGLVNDTGENLVISNTETGSNRAVVPPGAVLVIQGGVGHWNIPDCRDENEFPAHHMEIGNGKVTLHSFWDDPDNNYKLKTCAGTQFGAGKVMSGSPDLGNTANVVIRVQSGEISALVAQVAGS